jgi:hypothetical protein
MGWTTGVKFPAATNILVFLFATTSRTALQSGYRMNMTINFHVVLRLRMHGSKTPPPTCPFGMVLN